MEHRNPPQITGISVFEIDLSNWRHPLLDQPEWAEEFDWRMEDELARAMIDCRGNIFWDIWDDIEDCSIFLPSPTWVNQLDRLKTKDFDKEFTARDIASDRMWQSSRYHSKWDLYDSLYDCGSWDDYDFSDNYDDQFDDLDVWENEYPANTDDLLEKNERQIEDAEDAAFARYVLPFGESLQTSYNRNWDLSDYKWSRKRRNRKHRSHSRGKHGCKQLRMQARNDFDKVWSQSWEWKNK